MIAKQRDRKRERYHGVLNRAKSQIIWIISTKRREKKTFKNKQCNSRHLLKHKHFGSILIVIFKVTSRVFFLSHSTVAFSSPDKPISAIDLFLLSLCFGMKNG